MKIKKWKTSLLKKQPTESLKKSKFFTNDSNAYLQVEIVDTNILIHSATFTLFNKDDKSVISQSGFYEKRIASFYLTPEIIEHFGDWKFQVIFHGDKDYVSDLISFSVEPYLLDEHPLKLIVIDNWKVYKKQVNDLIDSIELEQLDLRAYVSQVEKMEGKQGIQGIQGIQGEKGDKGDKGDKGGKGDKGDKGEQGEQGLRGLRGYTGDTGATGDKGDTGDRGLQGFKGDKGDKGDSGIYSSGSKNNGEWIKFKNGVMMAWYGSPTIDHNVNTLWEGVYISPTIRWYYPEKFISPPQVFGELSNYSTGGWLLRSGGIDFRKSTTVSGDFRIVSMISKVITGGIDFFAIGRWY